MFKKIILMGICLGASIASAQKILVLPVTGRFDNPGDSATIDGLYRQAIETRFGGTVLFPQTETHCGMKECAMKAAEENGADEVVYSKVSRLGSKWIFSSAILKTDGSAAFNQSLTTTSIEDMSSVANNMADILITGIKGDENASRSNVRKPRPVAVSAEIGMNSLASMAGLTATVFVVPQVAVDLGLGLSAAGLRSGIRGRYLFSPKKFSPFAYGSLDYSSGLGTYQEEGTDNTLTVTVNSALFLGLGRGFDSMADNGFYWIACAGWSALLGGQDFQWSQDSFPSSDDKAAQKLIDGSGPTLSFSAGYAF